MNRDYLTKAEFKMFLREHNGSLKRIESQQGEIKGLIGTTNSQITSLIERENERINNLEECVDNLVDQSKFARWAWRGLVAFLGVALTVMTILAITHVI